MIRTESELCRRLGIPLETQALAAQTVTGGVKAYLRDYITKDGETRVLERGEDGKGVRLSWQVWEAIFNTPFHPRKKARGRGK
jgi:hypothetical protein